MGCEIQVLICVGGFSVDAGFGPSIAHHINTRVKEGWLAVDFQFNSEFDVRIDVVNMVRYVSVSNHFKPTDLVVIL